MLHGRLVDLDDIVMPYLIILLWTLTLISPSAEEEAQQVTAEETEAAAVEEAARSEHRGY